MHIAYLTPEYPHQLCPASGGLGTSIKNMAEALIKKGVQVSIILYGQKIDKTINQNRIDFYFLSQKSYQAGGWFFYRKFLEKRITEIIKKGKVDLLEAPDWTGITSFMRFEIPLLIRMNGTDAYFCALENRKQKPKNRFFEKHALKNAQCILAVSDFTGRKTMEILNLKRKYEVIPNSISISNFKASTNRAAIPNRILYFGTLIRKKGVLELAHSFNEVIKVEKEAKLILAGRDVTDIFETRSTLEIFMERLSDDARKKVAYLGVLPYSEIKSEIEKAAVVVLPSFAEALPMTWLEAMAMEKALVTSNIGWAPEVMINGETGFTVNPTNHQLYAEKVQALLKDNGLAIKMGKAARKRVEEKFSTEVVAEMNIQFYRKAISNKS